ncbi:hypothetical protein DUNSADRAFT_15550 [Dunaliella salina]|uniref:Flagellar associated protein n=1 Tax=Dunaliella salina TaxID=3046 RepID=A0ABQ7G570_DUNSA|nr:hypothetical protein DUNSADRAFT_15550 [Dunaliella salina]|eukprot:KAF5829748.1 hypothetical protein DUNSADRAFT_15550 [Dunaliella salina]
MQAKEFPAPHRNPTMQTQYRDSFGPQSKEAMDRIQKSAAEADRLCRAALVRSEIPLGKGGFQTLQSRDWISEYDKKYQKPEENVTGAYDAAQRYKQVLGGPTAPAGRTLPAWPSGSKTPNGAPSGTHPRAFMPMASA